MPTWSIILSRDFLPPSSKDGPPIICVEASTVKPGNSSGDLVLCGDDESLVLRFAAGSWHAVGKPDEVELLVNPKPPRKYLW